MHICTHVHMCINMIRGRMCKFSFVNLLLNPELFWRTRPILWLPRPWVIVSSTVRILTMQDSSMAYTKTGVKSCTNLIRTNYKNVNTFVCWNIYNTKAWNYSCRLYMVMVIVQILIYGRIFHYFYCSISLSNMAFYRYGRPFPYGLLQSKFIFIV